MENNTTILTRKIQIYIDCDDKKKRATYYDRLFDWQNIIFRASNIVLSHQFLQDSLKDLIYLTTEVKVKLADRNTDEEGILNTSRMNTAYRLLSAYFKGEIPTDILSTLNTTLYKNFQSDRKAYWKGERSLRTYKKDIPIPFSSKSMKLSNDEQGRDFKISLFKLPFRTYLGKDRSDKRILLQRVLVGQIKACSSAIKVIKGKIFLLLSLKMPQKDHVLQEHLIAEASLSIEHPISVSIDNDCYQIGTKEEFLYRRIAIQAARHRLQRAITYNRGGNGRKRKLKSLDHYNQKEKNYVDSRLHLYSRRLIDICIKSQAGTLLLVNQSNKEEIAKEDEFLLRNWSYYGLIEKIKYKAKMAGINVIIE